MVVAIVALSAVATSVASPSYAGESAAVPVPRFIAADHLETLRQAFFDQGMGQGMGQHVVIPTQRSRPLADGIPALLARQDIGSQPGSGVDVDLTTSDFQTTLRGARQDAGEMRALTEEVRQRNEELNLRFTAASEAGSTQIEGQFATADQGRTRPPSEGRMALGVRPVTTSAMKTVGVTVTDIKPGGVKPAGVKVIVAEPLPVETPPVMSHDVGGRAVTVHASGTTQTAAAAGDLEMPDLSNVPLAQIDAQNGAGSAAGNVEDLTSPVKQAQALRKHAGQKPMPERARKVKLRSKLASRNSEPERASKKTEPSSAAVAAAEPPGAPAKASTGLFSWFKPFGLPREIGALGWVTNN